MFNQIEYMTTKVMSFLHPYHGHNEDKRLTLIKIDPQDLC